MDFELIELIRIGLIIILVVGVIAYGIYCVNNIETIKADPLRYASERLGQNCQCFCLDPNIYNQNVLQDLPIPNQGG